MARGPEHWRVMITSRKPEYRDPTWYQTPFEPVDKKRPQLQARLLMVEEGDETGLPEGFYIDTNLRRNELTAENTQLLMRYTKSRFSDIPWAQVPDLINTSASIAMIIMPVDESRLLFKIQPYIPSQLAAVPWEVTGGYPVDPLILYGLDRLVDGPINIRVTYKKIA